MPLALKGATSGQVTIQAPAVAGTNTLTAPAVTGTLITSADSGTVTPAMISVPIFANSQSYQDVTASRATGTTYTNNSGNTIIVSIYGTGTANAFWGFSVNGVGVGYSSGAGVNGYNIGGSFIVPNGATYKVDVNNTPTITKWYEFR